MDKKQEIKKGQTVSENETDPVYFNRTKSRKSQSGYT